MPSPPAPDFARAGGEGVCQAGRFVVGAPPSNQFGLE